MNIPAKTPNYQAKPQALLKGRQAVQILKNQRRMAAVTRRTIPSRRGR